MKNTIVVVFLFLTTLVFSDWQQKEKVALPKGIQVNDLTVDGTGVVWIVSSSSILKLDPGTKSPILVSEFKEGKTMAVLGQLIYVVDGQNRLTLYNPDLENSTVDLNLVMSGPVQISALQVDQNPLLAILEQKKLRFFDSEKQTFYLNGDVDRFAALPNADYANPEVPLFTLSQDRVYAWFGGDYKNPANYQSRLLYSTSGDIMDLTADPEGKLYLLFADSVVILDNQGVYAQKVGIERVPYGSRLYSDPQNHNLIIYNPVERNLRVFTENRREDGESVVLDKNRPNPVDNYTEIEFTLGQSLDLTLTIYNLIGEPVKVVTRGYFSKGKHRAAWHADDERGNLVPNGVYFYRLESKKGFAIRQLIVLR